MLAGRKELAEQKLSGQVECSRRAFRAEHAALRCQDMCTEQIRTLLCHDDHIVVMFGWGSKFDEYKIHSENNLRVN